MITTEYSKCFIPGVHKGPLESGGGGGGGGGGDHGAKPALGSRFVRKPAAGWQRAGRGSDARKKKSAGQECHSVAHK